MKQFCFLLSLVFLFACTASEGEETALPLTEEIDMGVESFGVEYVYSDSAQMTAKLVATHVIEKKEGDKNNESVVHHFNDGVEVEFFDPMGRSRSHITAKSGMLYRDKRIAELNGDVVLTNANGERLETEQLFWNDPKDSIYTDKFVRIETPDKIITGSRGLRSNTSFTAYTIYGIRGEIETEDEPQPRSRPGAGRRP